MELCSASSWTLLACSAHCSDNSAMFCKHLLLVAEASYLYILLLCDCCCSTCRPGTYIEVLSGQLKWTSTSIDSMVIFKRNEIGFWYILWNTKRWNGRVFTPITVSRAPTHFSELELNWLFFCWAPIVTKATVTLVFLPSFSSRLAGFMRRSVKMLAPVSSRDSVRVWGSEEEHLSAAHVSGLQDH